MSKPLIGNVRRRLPRRPSLNPSRVLILHFFVVDTALKTPQSQDMGQKDIWHCLTPLARHCVSPLHQVSTCLLSLLGKVCVGTKCFYIKLKYVTFLTLCILKHGMYMK